MSLWKFTVRLTYQEGQRVIGQKKVVLVEGDDFNSAADAAVKFAEEVASFGPLLIGVVWIEGTAITLPICVEPPA